MEYKLLIYTGQNRQIGQVSAKSTNLIYILQHSITMLQTPTVIAVKIMRGARQIAILRNH